MRNRLPRAASSLLVAAFGAVTALASGGCATANVSGPAAITNAPADVVRVAKEPSGPDGLEVYDAEALFQRGLDLLEGDAWAEAADYFERLLREFPGDTRASLAHFNRGVAYIHLGRGDEAVAAFDAYLAALPANAARTDILDGRFKRGQALATAKRYEDVVAVFDELLGEELSPDDRVEALVDAGIGHYMLGLLPGGEQTHRPTSEYRFLEARRIVKKESATRRMDHMQFFMGQSAFYLAELAHLDFNDFKLTWPSQTEVAAKSDGKGGSLEGLLGTQLEEKCQRLLRAQYQYLRAIREGHAGWAAASGYSVGKMYEELHQEMVALPAPTDLTPEQQDLYQGMVRKKVLILLEKAEKTYAQTAEMVTRTGIDGVWAEKARTSLATIRQRILDESSAVAAAVPDDEPTPPVADAGRADKGKS